MYVLFDIWLFTCKYIRLICLPPTKVPFAYFCSLIYLYNLIWLFARSAPVHCLNQWVNIVNLTFRNNIQWNDEWNWYNFIPKMYLTMSSAKCRQFCLGLNVLTYSNWCICCKSIVFFNIQFRLWGKGSPVSISIINQLIEINCVVYLEWLSLVLRHCVCKAQTQCMSRPWCRVWG